MPWFYFIPYKLTSSMERKARPRFADFNIWNMLLYIVLGLIVLGMFAALVILPTILAMQETIPGG
jgi:hypothetical protein